jgi:hypothetical protein
MNNDLFSKYYDNSFLSQRFKLLVFLSFCFLSLPVFGQEMSSKTIDIELGETKVQLKVYTKQGEQISYVHIHENETASLAAGLEVLKNHGGKLTTLVHSFDGSKNRNVKFVVDKTSYQFDPNRIYTASDSVLMNSIQVVKGSGKVNQKIIKMVKNLADRIWSEASVHNLIVALHNNKNEPASYKTKWLFWKQVEPESYSVNSYVKKCDHASDSNLSCSDIYINPKVNNSEFFFVTERRDFSLFYKKRFTVILQNEKPVDDGSMSVFATHNNKRYINAEAKHGRVKEQTEMLELLHQF